MKTFSTKKKSLGNIKEKAQKSKVIIFASFARAGEKGLGVAEMTQLRRELRKINSEFVVDKKRVTQRAIKEAKIELDFEGMDGSIGTIFGYGDPMEIFKAVYAFAKKNPSLVYLGGMMEGKKISKADVTQLAKLPSREVLLGQIVGMMTYPVRSFMIVIDQLAKKS